MNNTFESDIRELKSNNILQTAKAMLPKEWHTQYHSREITDNLRAGITLRVFMLNYDDLITKHIARQGALDIRGL